MVKRKTHNRVCKRAGINKDTCDTVNKYIDEPSQRYPGCEHQNYRHDKKTCEDLGQILGKDAQRACEIHIRVDEVTTKCSPKRKNEEY